MKLTIVFICAFSVFSIAQSDQGKVISRGEEKKVSKKNTAYSYEKKINGTTVQFYTQEQFDNLEQRRKDYYLSHKEQYRINSPKKISEKK